MTPFALSLKSLRNRHVTVGLTVLSIAFSVALLLGVERIRREAQASFTSTISGTDLIVGARTSPVQLLLSSVFRLSDATNTMKWDSYQAIASHPGVAWTIPISLGDSHCGYRVLGTTRAYLDHLRYGRKQSLNLREGEWSEQDDGAVLGSEVAATLAYAVGDLVVVAHGAGEVSFIEHDEHPFHVTGILAPTGTPIDRTIHVSLAGIDAIHADMTGAPSEEDVDPLAAALARLDHNHDHEGHVHDAHCGHAVAGEITACFVGLQNRSAALGLQRMVNEYDEEALSAVMPASALQQLWELVGVVEKALLAVSGFVVLVGLTGMMVALMIGIDQRRREMAILRSVGARPSHILGLIVGEAGLVTFLGVVLGYALLFLLIMVLQPMLTSRLGLHLSLAAPVAWEIGLAVGICVAGLLIGLLPAYRSYRYSLADGLMVKV